MKTDRDSLFRQLEPPAGGAAAVRARLGVRAKPTPVFLRPVLAVVVLVVAGGWYLQSQVFEHGPGSTPQSAIYDSPEFDRLLGRTVKANFAEVSINGQLTHAIRSPESKVRFYVLD